MYKLSIVIPIYNTSKYLDQCFNSIRIQRYENYEVILVNDGSTDNSEKICLDITKKDKRFKYFKKTNGGLSSARNVGLDRAEGDFIWFIDSDDYIEKDSFEIIVKSIITYNADVIICGRYKDYGNKKNKVFESKKDKTYKQRTVIYEMLSGRKMDFSSCDKIFRKELWGSVRFPLGITSEDMVAIPKVIKKSNIIVKIKECLYYYRYTPNSITTAAFNSHTFDTLDILNDFETEFSSKKVKESLSFDSFKITQYLYYIQKLIFLNNEKRDKLNFWKYVSFFRKKLVIILLNPHIKFKTKINVVLAICPKIYKYYLEKKNEIK